jgi:hypothetical protein
LLYLSGLLLLALAPGFPQGLSERDDERAFVELVGPRSTCYVEQPLRLTIRFGVEREYLRHNVLQLFTRPLDVPVQLEFPPGLVFEPAEPVEADALAPHPSFALGEEIVRAARSGEETRAGRSWVVLEIDRELVPHAAGRLELPGPLLHFAEATRFDEDLVSGSVPLDRSLALVRGAPLVLEIAPLPDAGRPQGFVDAVGNFTLHAEAEPRELAIGKHLTLVLTLEGQGNLARLTLPRLDDLAGLHLLGRVEELSGNARTVSCEFVLESVRAREIPSIVLEYFDPELGSYRRASTQPIPLRVEASESNGGSRAVWIAALILLALGLAKFLRTRRSGDKA